MKVRIPMVKAPLALGALLFAAPGICHATVIYSNFGPSFTFDKTGGNIMGNSIDGNTYAEAGTFTPLLTTTFIRLGIALSCLNVCPGPDPVIVSLTRDNGDQPGNVIERFIVPALSMGALAIDHTPIFLNSILLPVLNAGTVYWITAQSASPNSSLWNWNTMGDNSDEAISTDGGATWFSPSGMTPGAFEVDGPTAVPEPVPVAMLLGGLCILGLARKVRASHSVVAD